MKCLSDTLSGLLFKVKPCSMWFFFFPSDILRSTTAELKTPKSQSLHDTKQEAQQKRNKGEITMTFVPLLKRSL